MQRIRNRNLRERIDEIAVQRNHLASLLNEANAKIIAQAQRIAELEAKLPPSIVMPFLSKSPKKVLKGMVTGYSK